jgi:multidrug transporter EmrE-like cation transporter
VLACQFKNSFTIAIDMTPLLLLFIGGCVLTIGDIVMKKWVVNNSGFLFIIGLAIYLAGLIFLAWSFKYKNIAVASVIFVIFNIITLSIVSWFYFKETLTGLQIAGMLLGISSIIFLELA